MPPRRRLTLTLAAAALLASTPAPGQTAPPAAERLNIYSPYEQQTAAEVLSARHLSLDPSPEGKLVERVDVVPLDVFEERDVLPRWLNVFHVTTRESVVRNEVLIQPGQRYEQALVDDTIRNLRRLPGLPQLSAVLVLAAAGSASDRVVLVVITKDVWSLRLNWNVVADAGGIDQLAFEPAETNFLGTHQIAGATFYLEPSAVTLGPTYTIPRIGDSRIAMRLSADVMINRQSESPEGTYGTFVAGEPLFSGKTEWAWDSTVAWQDAVLRRYQNAQLGEYLDPRAGCTAADPACLVPFEYRARTFTANYELTRSFGWADNHDFTLAANLHRAVYQTTAPGANPQTLADFVAQDVPVSDTQVGPTLQYHSYEMRFVRVVDFDTLALQEDYRLGRDVVVRVGPSLRALGSTRDFVDLYGAVQYTWAVRDGLFRVAFASDTEPQVDRISDAYLQPTAHLVTPTVAKLARLVVDGTLTWRWRNYLNQTELLGGADRLRGFPTNFFVGADVMSYNVEARTRPLEILSCEVAGVAFYDVGDAFSSFSSFIPYQTAGVGLRSLFPWLDRTVFQADLGFPLRRPLDPSTGSPIPPYGFILSFGQAFSTPTVAPQPVLPTGQGPDAP